MRVPSIVARACVGLAFLAPAAALAQGAPAAAAPAKTKLERRVELRIQTLHKELKITSAEGPQWDAVAQAMREDAETVGALVRERREKAATMNAVDDLRSYQAIAEAHAAGVAKVVKAFAALYEVMPPEQQKLADAVFSKSMHRRAMRRKEGAK